jgi:hypothetical protein
MMGFALLYDHFTTVTIYGDRSSAKGAGLELPMEQFRS